MFSQFFTSLEVFVCLSKTDCCNWKKFIRRSKLSITGSSTRFPLLLKWICWCWYSNWCWCWCWGWRRRRRWLWIFPRRRSIPSNEGSRPFRPIYQSPPKWPPSPHPIPNSPIVLVQLRPLVDVDALLTLLLLSPLSLSLSLFDRYHHCSWSKPWASDYITGFVFQWKFERKLKYNKLV